MQKCYFPRTIEDENEKENKSERMDGRGVDQLRPVYMKTNVVSHALGSAYVEMGDTKVICSVYGPRSDRRHTTEFSEIGQIRCDAKYSALAFRNSKRERTQLPEEIELSSIVEQSVSAAVILDKFPKCVMMLVIEILQAAGSESAAAVTCASLALADASVEMYDIVIASSACAIGSKLLIDPTHEEEKQADAEITFAFMPSLGEMSHLWQNGKIAYDVVQEGIDLCQKACIETANMAKVCLQEQVRSSN